MLLKQPGDQVSEFAASTITIHIDRYLNSIYLGFLVT